MPFSIGDIDLELENHPDEGEIQRVAPHRWVKGFPRGQAGTLLQYVGKGNREHRMHFFWPEDIVADVEAMYDAHADGGGPDTLIMPRPPFVAGVPVIITDFSAVWNSSVRGDEEESWYDCVLDVVERNP